MMSKLFIETYLDEDVDVLIALLLRSRGFVASTTVEAGHLGQGDEHQLHYSTAQGHVILTHNRADFERLAMEYFSSGQTHGGIIIATRRKPHEIASRLLRIINAVTADEMMNQVRYI